MALRAKMLDDRVRRFVDANPHGVVVDLGASAIAKSKAGDRRDPAQCADGLPRYSANSSCRGHLLASNSAMVG